MNKFYMIHTIGFCMFTEKAVWWKAYLRRKLDFSMDKYHNKVFSDEINEIY